MPRKPSGSLVLAIAVLSLPSGVAGGDALFPRADGGQEAGHWAWQRPRRPEPPAVKKRDWAANPLDAFILSKIEAAGLEPSPPATREELIRRVTLDLTGLPPTPAEIDAFLADATPQAFETVVDRLLASPRYGERWGRHWLDLARYADSNGYEHDEVRPDAWRYRDYVIRSFNSDKPYHRFIEEQLAGDLLYPGDLDALVATGFNLLGPDMTDAAEQAQRRQNTLNDMTDTAALVFLGLTAGCARCHDHKFEPIPQADYFRLQAFFTPAAFHRDLPIALEEERASFERRSREYQARIAPMREAIAAIEAPARARLREAKLEKVSDEAREAHRTPVERRTPAQKELVEKTERLITVAEKEARAALGEPDRTKLKELEGELKQFDSLRPPPLPVAMGLRDREGPAARTFILERGELGKRGEEVQAGFPGVLASPGGAGNGARSALALWISRADNPLTARVMVNRLFKQHFGRGIVPTPSDFGLRGERPTHPELLDWLAVELVERGWSLKAMHRLMLLSSTYRQSTRATAEALAGDPGNRLFSRMGRLRLEGEAVRDSLLAAGGLLSLEAGGPGVEPAPAGRSRRSVYLFARRNLRSPFLETFDFPDSNLSCPARERSTTALQALTLLNSPEAAEAARALAERVSSEARSVEEQVGLAYRLTLGRRPGPRELALAREFLCGSPLSELCRALFNLNEFVYVD